LLSGWLILSCAFSSAVLFLRALAVGIAGPEEPLKSLYKNNNLNFGTKK
jgi:hypothetical protein